VLDQLVDTNLIDMHSANNIKLGPYVLETQGSREGECEQPYKPSAQHKAWQQGAMKELL
jgi:hypothetical protein